MINVLIIFLLTILQEKIITVDMVRCGDGVNHTPGKSSHHCRRVLTSRALFAVLSSPLPNCQRLVSVLLNSIANFSRDFYLLLQIESLNIKLETS